MGCCCYTWLTLTWWWPCMGYGAAPHLVMALHGVRGCPSPGGGLAWGVAVVWGCPSPGGSLLLLMSPAGLLPYLQAVHCVNEEY